MNALTRILLASALAVLVAPLPSIADTRSDAASWCSRYTYETGVGCDSQRCPCGRTTTEVERWDRRGRFDWCACASKSDLRALENAPPDCTTATDCDDGIWCNGAEQCTAGQCQPGRPACGALDCIEETDQCVDTSCEDVDGDGFDAIHCGGDDCDDRDPNRFPGNIEICDARGIDEDCNSRTVGDKDEDGDGFISPECR